MKKNLFIAAMSLLVLAGCSNDDEINNLVANNENAITFDTYVGKVTKATTAIQQNFGVFAYYKAEGVTEDVAPNFMYNQLVDKNGKYSPTKFWPESGTIDFIAYSPMADKTNNGIELLGDNKIVGLPSLQFTLPATANTDLLVSSAIQGTSGEIQLTLGHKLSKVTFKVTPPTAEGTTITITDIKLTGVNTVATYSFKDGWNTLETPKEFAASTDGEFYMIPQSVTDIKAIISFSVEVEDTSLANGSFTFTKTSTVALNSVAAPNWETNKQYNYTINPTTSLDAVTISATVEDWTDPAIAPNVP